VSEHVGFAGIEVRKNPICFCAFYDIVAGIEVRKTPICFCAFYDIVAGIEVRKTPICFCAFYDIAYIWEETWFNFLG
jgi:hypothetical protein